MNVIVPNFIEISVLSWWRTKTSPKAHAYAFYMLPPNRRNNTARFLHMFTQIVSICCSRKEKKQIQKKKRTKYPDGNLHRTFPTAPPQKSVSESTHCSGSGTRVTAQRHVTPLSTRSDAAAACRLARAISDSGGGKWRVRCAGGVGSSPGSGPLFRCAG